MILVKKKIARGLTALAFIVGIAFGGVASWLIPHASIPQQEFVVIGCERSANYVSLSCWQYYPMDSLQPHGEKVLLGSMIVKEYPVYRVDGAEALSDVADSLSQDGWEVVSGEYIQPKTFLLLARRGHR